MATPVRFFVWAPMASVTLLGCADDGAGAEPSRQDRAIALVEDYSESLTAARLALQAEGICPHLGFDPARADADRQRLRAELLATEMTDRMVDHLDIQAAGNGGMVAAMLERPEQREQFCASAEESLGTRSASEGSGYFYVVRAESRSS